MWLSYQLREAVNEYIHYYNHERIKVKLNGLSPVQYRLREHQPPLNKVSNKWGSLHSSGGLLEFWYAEFFADNFEASGFELMHRERNRVHGAIEAIS